MSINLVTYANQTVTPTNDAIIYERAIDQNGIFYGCNVTVSSNEVHITGGYGMVCGREFTIQSESIAVTLAPSGTLDGRLYVRLDLADADAPIQLLTATGNTLPPLEQDDDVNYTNGAYEMELATFTVGVSTLSDVVETFEEIKGTTAKTRFSATLNSSLLDGTFDGVYDEASGIAQFICTARSTQDISTSTTIYTLPASYRPKQDTAVPALIVTDTGASIAFNAYVHTDGKINQAGSGHARSIVIFGSYKVK